MTTPTLPSALAAEPGRAVVHDASRTYDTEQLAAALTSAGVAWTEAARELDDHSRDWWPVSIGWAQHGELAARPSIVASAASTADVSAVVGACHAAGVPLTAQGGRSGVCGGAVPAAGGLALDMTGLNGIVRLDEASLRVRVAAGTFGPELERSLRERGFTLGHFPQSFDLSTVGGWVACRGAGQYSTRYGKIEDMVRGLTVVLADGTVVETGGAGPRSAVGPDLTQLFVGSEGTLGVITEVELVVHPIPAAEGRRACSFDTFGEGLEACRRILARGATPAVLRLYDVAESTRNFQLDRNVLIVLDEADPGLLDATLAVVDEECASAAPEDLSLVDTWLVHRNDVSALAPLWERGFVVDTMEVAAPWSALERVHADVVEAMLAVPGTVLATVHQSHAYLDGACLYFTFVGTPADDADGYYRAAWDAGSRAALDAGASLSHHHGIGRHRASYVRSALGAGFGVLESLKRALDPLGILNPGVLGLDTQGPR
jgi:alkyldihydroxyacetonephosphate synthase